MTPDLLRSSFLAVAQREIGVREVGGNNRGPRVVEYQRATRETPGAWPWCAAFCCWLVREWLAVPEVQSSMGVLDAETWRPRSALAFDFEDWGRARKMTVLRENAQAMPGDIVTFDFSHIGIVEVDAGSHLVTIEGNTNGSGERDSTSGDGVWRKRRTKPLVRRLIRMIG